MELRWQTTSTAASSSSSSTTTDDSDSDDDDSDSDDDDDDHSDNGHPGTDDTGDARPVPRMARVAEEMQRCNGQLTPLRLTATATA